jgi:hypothetical protein
LLSRPHKCPDPVDKASFDNNCAVRFSKRTVWPPFGGADCARMNRKLIHSKFCQTKTFKPGDDESFYTSVAFSVSERLQTIIQIVIIIISKFPALQFHAIHWNIRRRHPTSKFDCWSCKFKLFYRVLRTYFSFTFKGGRNPCAMSRIVHFTHRAEPVRQVDADLVHLAPTSLQHV